MIYILTLLGFLVLTIIRLCILWWLFYVSILFLQWFQYLSQDFPTMCPLHPFKAPICFGNTNPSLLWAKSKTLRVVKMFVSSVLSFFIIHFKVRVIQNFNLPNFLVSLLALTTIIFYTDFSVLQESIVHGFFKANDQVWINFKLFVRNSSTPCCYYLEIISIFAWSSLQYFVTCKASIQLFTGTVCCPVSGHFSLKLQ